MSLNAEKLNAAVRQFLLDRHTEIPADRFAVANSPDWDPETLPAAAISSTASGFDKTADVSVEIEVAHKTSYEASALIQKWVEDIQHGMINVVDGDSIMLKVFTVAEAASTFELETNRAFRVLSITGRGVQG